MKHTLCPHGFPAAEHPPNCDTEWEDDGPGHRRALCIPGDWLCRYPAGDGHSIHAPYVQGEYLADAEPDQPQDPAARDEPEEPTL